MKLAAIDIGSNAARLLISEVTPHPDGTAIFNKINLVRVPLRLGFDVFETGEISPQKQKMLLETLSAYKHLINAYDIKHVIACATSAMRDAGNTKDILQKIEEKTGIKIEVITGSAEAAFIYENHIAENMDKEHSYLYIDVGGGSTELTFFSNGALVFKDSYNIGTIRLLKNRINESAWNEMKETIKEKTKGHKEVTAIGSGGNINKVLSLSKKKEDKPRRHHPPANRSQRAEERQQSHRAERRCSQLVTRVRHKAPGTEAGEIKLSEVNPGRFKQ